MKTLNVDSIIDSVTRSIEGALAIFFMLAVLICFINVCARYLLSRSILSADEIQVFVMIMMTFLGSATVTWRRQQLRMALLVDMCPLRIRKYCRFFESATLIIICGFVTYQSFLYTRQSWLLGKTSDTAGIPMWIPHSSIFIGFALMLSVVVLRAFSEIARSMHPRRADSSSE